MEKLTEVLAMGGYAAYVWPAFAVGFVILTGMVLTSLRALHKARRMLTELQPSSEHET